MHPLIALTALLVIIILIILSVFGTMWKICINMPAGSRFWITTPIGSTSKLNLSSVMAANPWLIKTDVGGITGPVPPYQLITINPNKDIGASWSWTILDPNLKTIASGSLAGDDPGYIWAWPTFMF